VLISIDRDFFAKQNWFFAVRDKTRRRVTKLQLHPVGRFAFDEVQV
jgi:hypothetical protein